jgi:hypothetical protein
VKTHFKYCIIDNKWKERDVLEIEIVLPLVTAAILLSFLFHRIDKNTKRSTNKTVFGGVLIISVVLILAGLLLGEWNGLIISAIGVYLLIPSISALFINLILQKTSNKRT